MFFVVCAENSLAFGTNIPCLEGMDNIVVHCKMGGRSAQAYEVLKNAAYTRIKNLQGGILAWADQVDPAMQKY